MSKKNIKYIPRLYTHYKNKSIPELMKKLNIENVNRIPKLEKVVINIGIGNARDNANALKNTVSELSLISGQKPFPSFFPFGVFCILFFLELT